MNETLEFIDGMPQTTYEVGIQDIIGQQMQSYALLLVILSTAMLLYVLWNNFVRAPSKKESIKSQLNVDNMIKSMFDAGPGQEVSVKVKGISRAIDEYMIIPALVMFYISFSYYNSIGV